MLNINCDGGSRGNPGPAASSFVVEAEGKIIYKFSKFLGVATNNVAEYTAVLEAFNWLESNKRFLEDITFVLDSELVVKQLRGLYKIKNLSLKKIYNQIKNKEIKFTHLVIYKKVPREENQTADFLVNEKLNEMSKRISHV
ncbi:ribonuclease HI family protein [Candidatus Woesebacteria bacterium]|nr:ribonuclease HI family protein [Candidatus Woesebacteria bacterium]